MTEQRERVEIRSFTAHSDEEWALLDKISSQLGLNASATVRYIIRRWYELEGKTIHAEKA
jgi:hypothetical protein